MINIIKITTNIPTYKPALKTPSITEQLDRNKQIATRLLKEM